MQVGINLERIADWPHLLPYRNTTVTRSYESLAIGRRSPKGVSQRVSQQFLTKDVCFGLRNRNSWPGGTRRRIGDREKQIGETTCRRAERNLAATRP